MPLKSKINLFSLLIILSLPLLGWLYYRSTRPVPLPPPEPRKEINITILPGWNLRQIADDWVEKGIVKTPQEVFFYTGTPATDYRTYGEAEPVRRIVTSSVYDALLASKPTTVSYEGYLLPETYRIYADAKPDEVIKKILAVFADRFTPELQEEVEKYGKSFFEVLTMASIVEREARTAEDRAMVADILWRRAGRNMLLQVDSAVHYVSARTGDVFTTDEERASDSPWNTYKFKGLPPGPISNPSISSITATLNPTANNYWYFLTGRDGAMYYARTYDEHLVNANRYLR